MVKFPFSTFNNGKPQRTYINKDELLTDIEMVLTDETLDQMSTTTYADLILNWRGGGLARGRVWFNAFNGEIKIFRISG